MLTTLVTMMLLGVSAALAAANPITVENAKPGSPNWKYPEAPRGTVSDQYAGTVNTIEGFTSDDSLVPGQQLELHVSANSGWAYRVEVYRLGWYGGAGARRVACSPSCSGSRAGVVQPPLTPMTSTGYRRAPWSVTDTVPVTTDWTSGYYIAQLLLTEGPYAGNARWVPFIVRTPAGSSSSILAQVPVNNWQAYNGWGGRSTYINKSVDGIAATHVSFDRPYWGAMYDMFDHELGGIRFLEREGYDVQYATDRDVNDEPGLLLNRSMVLVNGHDEYWTSAQRDAFENARNQGVSLMFLGANIAYWQVRYADGGRTMIAYKEEAASDPEQSWSKKTDLFRNVGRPECQLLGIQYDNSWKIDAQVRSYRVDDTGLGHRWMNGTGFNANEVVTDTVGYEWDFITPGCSHPPLTRFFEWDGTEIPGETLPPADAVGYTAPSGARVFSAGSLHFTRGLDSWRSYTWIGGGPTNAKLQRFVRNVLNDMTSTPPVVPPTPQGISPNASFVPSIAAPIVGEQVTFTDTSTTPIGTIVARAWDLDGDGVFMDGTAPTAATTFATAGTHRVGLRVTNSSGTSGTTWMDLQVNAPTITINRELPAIPEVNLDARSWKQVRAKRADAAAGCRRPARRAPRGARLGISGCVRP
ncbi:MAG: PKD domain-containing protein [Actinobacteria bacterium]|nr:PKD domain-containing protein [Actinomycetota bacterium]